MSNDNDGGVPSLVKGIVLAGGIAAAGIAAVAAMMNNRPRLEDARYVPRPRSPARNWENERAQAVEEAARRERIRAGEAARRPANRTICVNCSDETESLLKIKLLPCNHVYVFCEDCSERRRMCPGCGDRINDISIVS